MKAFALVLIIAAPLAWASQTPSPYAGQEHRQIKALSESEIQGLLSGSGMGYAKAAELNRYPGPKHVLELAEKLRLSEQQVAATQRLYQSMNSRAVDLGRRLVHKEKELDDHFSNTSITPDRLQDLLTDIARLQADIRYIHLEAHLQQRELLSEHQAQHYDRLRGYGQGHGDHQH